MEKRPKKKRLEKPDNQANLAAGALVNDLTSEEAAELALHRQAILAKRAAADPRVCRICGKYAPNTGICPACEEESKTCPLCGDKSGLLVCRACINAGAPWCRYCRRVRPDSKEMCDECYKLIHSKGASAFKEPAIVPGTIPANARVYEAASPGAEMPAPTTAIPV